MDPLHITEFASERYFSKLRQLNEHSEGATSGSGGPAPATAADLALPPPPSLHQPTFTLPLGNPRQQNLETSTVPTRTSDQKKRSLGHDLTSLRTQRRPSFSGSFGSLRSKVSVVHKTPSIVEHYEHILAEEDGTPQM